MWTCSVVLVREAGGRHEEQAEEHNERHCRDGHDEVEAFDVEQGLVFLRMEWEKKSTTYIYFTEQ